MKANPPNGKNHIIFFYVCNQVIRTDDYITEICAKPPQRMC